jgi:hypothetical protein
MAITGKSRSERFSRWQLVVNNLKESAALPHVTEEIAQLEAMLAQARALQDRYEDFRTQAREVLAELDQLGRAGDEVRGRLGANLRGKFGFSSESLFRYGYKPNPATRRRTATLAKAKAGTPQPEPEPQPSAAATTNNAAKTEA